MSRVSEMLDAMIGEVEAILSWSAHIGLTNRSPLPRDTRSIGMDWKAILLYSPLFDPRFMK